jgi:NADH:ubiquinone reductase (non-electrogenic)
LQQDAAKLFNPQLLKLASITIVDLQDFILSSYDRRIAEYATAFFQRQKINLKLGAAVKEVLPGELVLADKATKTEMRLPFGLCVWATGIKLHPLAQALQASLGPDAQPNTRSLTTDASLRVKGASGIFALGDACTIELKPAAPHAARLMRGAISLSRAEAVALLNQAAREFPHLAEAAARLDESSFATAAPSGRVGEEEMAALLSAADKGLRSLPATAQVAKQQGEFLACLLASSSQEALEIGTLEEFAYVHRGSLAYIGADNAVADIPGFSILKGLLAGLVWKGFETVSQISLRNRLLVAGDLMRAKFFGRDLSRL